MADITSTQTTATLLSVAGSQRFYRIDYSTATPSGLTTAAAVDTVATPFTVVQSAYAMWNSSAAVAANQITCALSTVTSNVIVCHSTHDSLAIRIFVQGR